MFLNPQDVHLATVSKDLEKQQGFLDRMKSDVRHEIDKLTASQRLDLNLEKGANFRFCLYISVFLYMFGKQGCDKIDKPTASRRLGLNLEKGANL